MCDLYGVEELPYRQSFRVTSAYARERWVRGVEEITRQANVLGVTLIDDLLGSTIKLLRGSGDLPEPPGQSDTGLSAKLNHLVDVAGLKVHPGTVSLHRLCLAIRNSVVHDGARQMKVISAWEKLENPERE